MGTFISVYDRQQALNRIVEKARNLGLEENLTKIDIAINSSDKFEKCFYPAVEVIHPWKEIKSYPSPFKNISPKKIIEETQKAGASLWIRNNKYLVLQIDLTRKKTDVMREIESIISVAVKNVPKTKKRDRNNTLDHWKIYDMRHKDGLNFREIANKLWPNRGTNYLDLKNDSMQVKRAHDKAKRIIQQVEKELNL
ncbi:MAG: hypothetical protein HUU07_16510 [Candidatus Brocadia sinica]|nr:hypothetical protein [Candidatus Brocadia sinica]